MIMVGLRKLGLKIQVMVHLQYLLGNLLQLMRMMVLTDQLLYQFHRLILQILLDNLELVIDKKLLLNM